MPLTSGVWGGLPGDGPEWGSERRGGRGLGGRLPQDVVRWRDVGHLRRRWLDAAATGSHAGGAALRPVRASVDVRRQRHEREEDREGGGEGGAHREWNQRRDRSIPSRTGARQRVQSTC